MAASDLLAGTVMNTAASLMNDTARTVYTYAVQVPYLNLAMHELREEFELNSVSTVQQTSTIINMPAGAIQITYNAVGQPRLPDDMIEPQELWERQEGIDPFIPMTKLDYLPHNLEGMETNQFIYFIWNGQAIQVLPSNQDNDIKIDYIKQLFVPVVNEASIINVINAQSFLEYRTAGLLAEFIERNLTSATSMNNYATLALDRATGIKVKGKQSISTRRRPFRSGYKKMGWMT